MIMCYEEPILEVIYFSQKDVVTASSPEQTGDDWGDNHNPWA